MNTASTTDVALAESEQADTETTADEVGPVIEALSWRLMESTIAVAEMCTIYLGERLGLYRALERTGPADVATVAREAGVALRYAQEWCEQQAVAGFVAVDDMSASSNARRYSLPPGHEAVLAQPESPAYLAPLGLMAAGISSGLPTLAAAFRTGDGVPYAAYGSSGREAQEALNRAGYLGGMSDWVALLPDIQTRLRQSGARVADIGCGCGWSSAALAASFPDATVVGVDVDQPSIERAREVALAQGVAGRVEFVHADATTRLHDTVEGDFDLITVFEALHDTARPVDVLSGIRSLLRPGGAVLIAEPAIEEQFTAPGSPMERMFLASSVLFCLPTAMSGTDAEPTGAAMRPDLLRRLAADAGFTNVSVVPVEHPMWRFYRLDA
jgi:2-polyprenyl-3-methyl-5-hydroxy-6-metoxy-1,4-benzoquinol methylase